MVSQCASDINHLKHGKKVMLKSFLGTVSTPDAASAAENYWQLIGVKGCVVSECLSGDGHQQKILIQFDRDFHALGLASCHAAPDSLWVLLSDLKFVCRY